MNPNPMPFSSRPSGSTCPPSVIANAREVWFQVAGMPHSDFYPLIAAARSHGIPVYYFSSTGVKRSLRKLLEAYQEV